MNPSQLVAAIRTVLFREISWRSQYLPSAHTDCSCRRREEKFSGSRAASAVCLLGLSRLVCQLAACLWVPEWAGMTAVKTRRLHKVGWKNVRWEIAIFDFQFHYSSTCSYIKLLWCFFNVDIDTMHGVPSSRLVIHHFFLYLSLQK